MTWKEKVIPEPRVLRVSRNSLVIETAVADQLYFKCILQIYRYSLSNAVKDGQILSIVLL